MGVAGCSRWRAGRSVSLACTRIWCRAKRTASCAGMNSPPGRLDVLKSTLLAVRWTADWSASQGGAWPGVGATRRPQVKAQLGYSARQILQFYIRASSSRAALRAWPHPESHWAEFEKSTWRVGVVVDAQEFPRSPARLSSGGLRERESSAQLQLTHRYAGSECGRGWLAFELPAHANRALRSEVRLGGKTRRATDPPAPDFEFSPGARTGDLLHFEAE